MSIGVLNGDDIGHEIVPETIGVMKTAAELTGLEIGWHHLPIGRKALDEFGTTMPEDTLPRLEALDGWVLGPIGHQAYPKVPQAINPHPILRKHFDLHANIRPARSYPTLPSVHQNVDLVIVRENNEGFQPDRNVVAGSGEFRPSNDMTISVRVITRQGSSKVARAAFELARSRRKKLTAVHKDTVFKLGCGMFAEECRKLAAEFPDVAYQESMVDTFAMRLVMRPQDYDVVVTTNMFGDILSDEAAGLVGGLGLAPGLCVGPRWAMAQATHGSAPDIAGRGIANPYAMIMSGQMLLAWLGRSKREAKAEKAAELISAAVDAVIAAKSDLTPDLGGTGTTQDMGRAICAAMQQGTKRGT
ncbi:MAG TPA: isocitrate/isopropylmalate dehydrogenase family protein [Terriglobia bacterium]|nr:isocitrate/isopropylmalate dehydrogenase family protein [Terriglobia bacterium]